jgi:hypothetical protein
LYREIEQGGFGTRPYELQIGKPLMLHAIYMDASRLPRCFCVFSDRLGCSSISGLIAVFSAGPDEIR